MLASIQAALSETGKSNAAISREIGRSPQTIWNWFRGHVEIPQRMRKNLCIAIGCEIDWAAYQAEFGDRAAMRQPKPAPPAPAPKAPAPAPAPAPMPRSAPQAPATAPRRLTATPPAKAAQRPPVASPAPAARKGGILGFLFDPSDDGMDFA